MLIFLAALKASQFFSYTESGRTVFILLVIINFLGKDEIQSTLWIKLRLMTFRTEKDCEIF